MHRTKLLGVLFLASVAAGCSTTSGSSRLDETGEQFADGSDEETARAEPAAFYIQSLRGGLAMRIPGLKLSAPNRSRALEAEYKALETAPSGQEVAWEGDSGVRGVVKAAVPFQVGSQNCRQYTHTISVRGAAPQTARGAACRNANGSWTPLS